MKHFLFLLVFSLLFAGCSAKQDALHVTPNTVSALTTELTHLSDTVDYQEARMFAYEALLYPQILAERYGLVYPPTFHNFLINTGLKERGLCYEWSEDMTADMIIKAADNAMYLSKSEGKNQIKIHWHSTL